MEVLSHLLSFNPYHRVSTRECLNHSIFDPIRVPHNELPALHKIKIDLILESNCFSKPEFLNEELLIEIYKIINNEYKIIKETLTPSISIQN